MTPITPSQITTEQVFTNSNGEPVTVTQIVVNPSLSPDDNSRGSGGSSFFSNTGAVAGVFVLVGLAAASILLWIIFAVRRRRRNQRLEHDAAVSASLAAAGFNRQPLDDDDDGPAMTQRSSSGLALSGGAATLSSMGRNSAYLDDYNPYRDHGVAPRDGGYVPARTASPPPGAGLGPAHRQDDSLSSSHRGHSVAGSFEPLLANYRPRTASPSSPQVLADVPGPTPPTPPPRNPLRTASPPTSPVIQPAHTRASSVYSTDSTADDRLIPGLKHRSRNDAASVYSSNLRDNEDYSRPVLGVRNPDNVSRQNSTDS